MMVIEFPKQSSFGVPTTDQRLAKIKRAILRELSDDFLHSIEEIARAIDVHRADVKDALRELEREQKVFTMRRRWSQS